MSRRVLRVIALGIAGSFRRVSTPARDGDGGRAAGRFPGDRRRRSAAFFAAVERTTERRCTAVGRLGDLLGLGRSRDALAGAGAFFAARRRPSSRRASGGAPFSRWAGIRAAGAASSAASARSSSALAGATAALPVQREPGQRRDEQQHQREPDRAGAFGAVRLLGRRIGGHVGLRHARGCGAAVRLVAGTWPGSSGTSSSANAGCCAPAAGTSTPAHVSVEPSDRVWTTSRYTVSVSGIGPIASGSSEVAPGLISRPGMVTQTTALGTSFAGLLSTFVIVIDGAQSATAIG